MGDRQGRQRTNPMFVEGTLLAVSATCISFHLHTEGRLWHGYPGLLGCSRYCDKAHLGYSHQGVMRTGLGSRAVLKMRVEPDVFFFGASEIKSFDFLRYFLLVSC